jgi:hypothetical protein
VKSFIASLEALSAQIQGNRLAALIGVSTVMTASILSAGMAMPNDWAAAAALAALQNQGGVVADAPSEDSSSAGALPPPPSAGPAAPAPAPQPTPQDTTPTDTTPDETTPTTTTEPTTTTTTPEPPPLPVGTRVKHVFVISLDSPGYDSSFGEPAAAKGAADPGADPSTLMPYLSETLRPQGLLLDQYSLVDAKSGMPNQIAAISGQKPNPLTKRNCPKYEEFPTGSVPNDEGQVEGKGCVYPVDALTVADQIGSAGLLWRGYAGDMGNAAGPSNCVRPASGVADETREASPNGQYVSWRNPFIYFHSLVDLGSCGLNDVPLDQLQTDLQSAKTTTSYSFISPKGCDSGAEAPCPAAKSGGARDGASSGATNGAAADDPSGAQAAAADEFLKTWVPKILLSKAYKKDGLLVITFGDTSAPKTLADRDRVGALVLSPFITPGATDSGSYDAYSLLKSTEDFFGVGYLGEARDTKTASFAFNALGSGD